MAPRLPLLTRLQALIEQSYDWNTGIADLAPFVVGDEGYRRLYREAREGVPDLQVEIEEVTVVADRAVACIRFFGRGRESRAPVEVRETHVARMRAGKLVEVREYRTKEEALRAVAKSE